MRVAAGPVSAQQRPWFTALPPLALRAGLVAILLLAVGLRFYHLDAQSLWNDEGTSVALAQRDLTTIARDAANDIHPPLYYWLLSAWVRLFGGGEAAVRSLSALLGVALVALTYAAGRLAAGPWTGALAAVLAAVSPFQVYYSQEARAYMLLAVLAAAAVLSLLSFVRQASWRTVALLVSFEAAGLYTHYSFVFIALVLNLAFVLQVLAKHSGWNRNGQDPQTGLPSRLGISGVARRLVLWSGGQVVAFLIFLPWLPIALRQVTGWPSPARTPGFPTALAETWRWLVLGPTIETTQAALPLMVAALLAVVGGWQMFTGTGDSRAGRWQGALPVVWLVFPAASIFLLGLYREAYIKFLLVVSPPLCVLMASGLLAGPQGTTHHSTETSPRLEEQAGEKGRSGGFAPLLLLLRFVQVTAVAVLLIFSVIALHNYYGDPAYARDDYRAMAAYIEAVGQPGDAVLLNAPGQQEVFRYYYRGDLPVHPLPTSRPLERAATEAALVGLVNPGDRVFAVLWATDESDPERVIEGWLDSHTYKALDTWYGNVRLAVYAVPAETPVGPDQEMEVRLQNPDNRDTFLLRGYSLPNDRLAAGDIAQVSLFWQAIEAPLRRYKVFLHALDEGNHIVGQRDSEPGGGARLTTLWTPGETIADHHGLPVHPATPPGRYRLEVGLYDAETGSRLVTPQGADQVWLEPLTVQRPSSPPPAAALGMQYDEQIPFGELTLLGYDAHKQGQDPRAQVRLRPGEVLQVALYWRAEVQPQTDWQIRLSLEGPGGRPGPGLLAEPVAGYPTSRWQAGDLWRGLFSLVVPADTESGDSQLRLEVQAPEGMETGVTLSAPVPVGH